ncbi:substrate-binding domain-containing protein [Mucilaginibacter dorajii]|uniref:GntR family transcriptional regulator n=1 Tax=Mucilaginibacter dorajii TaxID=692994 RepID=A0ABP7QYL3_9SPHI|nr:substrate-binding domain-containing protein [Mucilaginibacter dorajii]MCS3732327.1 DNA-binding transcriptional regulator YhcF (GntR family) [Mucilaginibacter dorajii]
MKNYLKLVEINENSITPKYVQVINSILRGVESGKIVKNDILPSVYDFSIALETSRNTIERAYKELKKLNVVNSVTGKGYFISDTNFNQPIKVLLLFNKLSSHKKIIYDAFAATLGNNAAIDFYIYNNDFGFFKKLVLEKIDSYSKFVVIPHFIDYPDSDYTVINTIPKEKLILMDKIDSGVTGDFGAVYEDFENDIYGALKQLLDKLSKYQTIKILFPEQSYYSKGILTGFLNFCSQYTFDYEVLPSLVNETIKPGTVYINLMEDHLVELLEKIMLDGLSVGTDVGVISYNETPLKKILLNGITTISTDFKMMGEKAAEMVLTNSTQHIAIPFGVTMRNSL